MELPQQSISTGYKMKTPICMTIAGSDSGGEAGIQADLKTFNDHGLFGTSVITATTAQNPAKIISINPVSPQALQDQLQALSYFHIPFIKTGLLISPTQIDIVANEIQGQTLITDPIIASTSGAEIMNAETLTNFKNKLLPKVSLLTPNWPEAEILSGLKIDSIQAIKNILKSLYNQYGCHIYLKGGHSKEPTKDYFYDGKQITLLNAESITIKSSHGTGCRLSSAICAALAKGEDKLKAAISAKRYVHACLKSCISLSEGTQLMHTQGHSPSKNNSIIVKSIND
jgi:hydroxymethylpyrimidine/phosphomethylpyrimidine kinase